MNRAAVAIPEKLFFKIGEVCELTGVQAHVLRYWESEFPMLAPQKNRAGQRTYRKRDVEMALRIKELLYEDQYTIAGAKKKLSAELRGASKLKVVTSEMTAPQPQAVPPPASPPPTAAPVATQSFVTESAPAIEPRPQRETALQTERAALTADQRTAVRHLAHQLLDLLSTLDAGEADIRPQGK
ncbi:MAG TPA: MerR family transcriptional regulator [Pyrinomonadaceae bacterium]|jgi:DNA-binding transcriptional MerR regulator